MYFRLASIASAILCTTSVIADVRPDSHAPIAVMGDHIHKQGELMLSYRFMHMSMQGNRNGSDSIPAATIATTAPNRFANPPTMPPTLRVVPTEMSMQMHMFGAMYAPNDVVTLMAMLNYVDKEMDHITFAGPTGATELGQFTTRSNGIGDTRLAALIRVADADRHRIHATLGVSLPTGSTDETASVLTPMNTTPELRMPYPMQLGSGSYDLIGGLTWARNGDRFSGGSQWRSTVRFNDNDEGYRFGDEHTLSGWLSYRLRPSLSLSSRVSYFDRANIDGIDPLIMAPVQTADPDRQGIERVDFALGANWVLPGSQHRLALEFIAPVMQRLDGPQLETDWQFVLGWQFAR